MFTRRSTLIVLALLLAPFLLVGCSSHESGPLEAVDTAPPAAPIMNDARAVGTFAVLHWARNAETDVAGYNVYFFAPDPGSDDSYTKLNSQLVTTTMYEVTGLTAGMTYNFKITAVDWSGNESACSQPASVYVTDVERDSGEGIGKLR